MGHEPTVRDRPHERGCGDSVEALVFTILRAFGVALGVGYYLTGSLLLPVVGRAVFDGRRHSHRPRGCVATPDKRAKPAGQQR
ncbi:MAG: hypothetical protein J07HX64_01002 [halophilic archaeon J07HX64]|nr:MAG: hypothetical protein J07HX64_01002 [halophilic archaeon J07HX64]